MIFNAGDRTTILVRLAETRRSTRTIEARPQGISSGCTILMLARTKSNAGDRTTILVRLAETRRSTRTIEARPQGFSSGCTILPLARTTNDAAVQPSARSVLRDRG